ncbi:hypothetical protein IJ531_05290 [bacterium]|nr:hypothetical protein [bacterium]
MIRILFIILLLFNVSFASSIKGRITFTEDTARSAAFKDLARKIPRDIIKPYLKDENTKINIESLKNKTYIIDDEPKRSINPFLAWDRMVLYSVEYENDLNKKYYYNPLGHLVKYEINDYAGYYPYRAIAYNKKGDVINITFVVSEIESYIFDKDEKLIGHWLNNQFFDKDGKQKENLDRPIE